MATLPAYCEPVEAAGIFADLNTRATLLRAEYVDRQVLPDLRPFYQGTGALPTYCSQGEYDHFINQLNYRADRFQLEWYLDHTPPDLLANAPDYYQPGSASTLPAGATLVRGSTGWVFDNTRTLVARTANTPRYQYDPASSPILLQGLLVEPASTNSIRNSSMVGTVVGSPGTIPTNWVAAATQQGMAVSVVATGIEDGIPYTDFRFLGTASGGGLVSVQFDGNTAIPAAQADLWAGSVFARLIAGSGTNLSFLPRLRITERTAAGGAITTGDTSPSAMPPAGPLRTQRLLGAYTLPSATAGMISLSWCFNPTNGLGADLTVRLGAPQLEKLATVAAVSFLATSPILTTGAALARAVDVYTVPVPAGTYSRIDVIRQSGTASYFNVVVPAGGYVVPTDPSPVKQVLVSY